MITLLITLLLPLVIPYGSPYTAHNPRAHYLRKVEFFRWVETVNKQHQKYHQVPLLLSGNTEKAKI